MGFGASPERCESGSTPPNQTHKVRVARLADRQWGRVSWDQLRGAGVSKAGLSAWVAEGYLHRVLPGVYAVGYRAASVEADLTAGLLYAGPGAMLSHVTAAWWWQLIDRQPEVIEISTPRQCESQPGIRIHARRALERVWHRRLTVTSVAQTLLDFAATARFDRVRYALSEADYRRLLDFDQVTRILGRGKPGSVVLGKALEAHRPDLALTRSRLEQEFLALCEAGGLPRPQLNVKVCGLTVDVYWPEQRVVVELDGQQGHGTAAQVARDHRRDLTLRAASIAVRRYCWDQVHWQGPLVLADLRRIV